VHLEETKRPDTLPALSGSQGLSLCSSELNTREWKVNKDVFLVRLTMRTSARACHTSFDESKNVAVN
jgi:hypothetical protein